MSTKYNNISNITIKGAIGKELTQSYLVGNIPEKYYPYSALAARDKKSDQIFPLDWAGISLIKKLTEYYGDGVTGKIWKKELTQHDYYPKLYNGYYSNKVNIPNLSNLIKYYYVKPWDEK